MKNNKGFAPILIALVFAVIAAVGGGAYYANKKADSLPKSVDEKINVTENNYQKQEDKKIEKENNIESENTSDEIKEVKKPVTPVKKVASKCGFTISSPALNSTIYSSTPVVFNGVVDNNNSQTLGCQWTMFEGEAGTAQLYYKNGNTWGPIGIAHIIPVADWMTTGPVPFVVSVSFNNSGPGFSAGTLMKVVFTEENPSGATADTLEFPLVLQ